MADIGKAPDAGDDDVVEKVLFRLVGLVIQLWLAFGQYSVRIFPLGRLHVLISMRSSVDNLGKSLAYVTGPISVWDQGRGDTITQDAVTLSRDPTESHQCWMWRYHWRTLFRGTRSDLSLQQNVNYNN